MLHIKFRDVGNTEFLPHQFKNSFLGSLISAAPIVGPVLSTAGSIFGGSIAKQGSDAAAKAALQATRETNAANLKLAQYQNDWNLAQWNRQNAYNSPTAQRARSEEALDKDVFHAALELSHEALAESIAAAAYLAARAVCFSVQCC